MVNSAVVLQLLNALRLRCVHAAAQIQSCGSPSLHTKAEVYPYQDLSRIQCAPLDALDKGQNHHSSLACDFTAGDAAAERDLYLQPPDTSLSFRLIEHNARTCPLNSPFPSKTVRFVTHGIPEAAMMRAMSGQESGTMLSAVSFLKQGGCHDRFKTLNRLIIQFNTHKISSPLTVWWLSVPLYDRGERTMSAEVEKFFQQTLHKFWRP